jgi:hypothetical protein
VGLCRNHIEQTREAIKRISHHNDALIDCESAATLPLGIVRLNDPDRIVDSALPDKTHLQQVSIERASRITIGSCRDSGQSLKVFAR